MELTVLLFNIYTLYLLHPIMATHQRLCGSNLVDALSVTCRERGYYHDGVNSPTLTRRVALSFLTTESHPRRTRRRSGRIVDECCLKDCSRDILESYCMPRITTPTPTTPAETPSTTQHPIMTSTTSRPTFTSTTQQQRLETSSTQQPIEDNVLRDYESPTNEGPLTSGVPTPTENRISSTDDELREPLNASVEVPTRTAMNSSRFEGAVQDSSDQDSLGENSESEAPTSGTRRRTKKPKTKTRKNKNKKDRKKKKEKNRVRNTSRRHRGDSEPDPTRSGQQPSSSEQSRQRPEKVNESQRRPNDRDPSGGGGSPAADPRGKITQKILESLSNVEFNRPIDLDQPRPRPAPQRYN